MSVLNDQSPAPPASDVPSRVVLDAYRQVLNYLFLATLAVAGGLVVLIFFPGLIFMMFHQTWPPLSIFPLVILAGTLGAFFSALLRLYEIKNLPAVLYEGGLHLNGLSLFIYALTPALIGAIAAAILYLIFLSGLLQGTPFPQIGCAGGEGQCSSLSALLGTYGPKGSADFAKAILWGFVAGFAERLVPDLLENFAQSDALKKAGLNGDEDADGADKAGGKSGAPRPDPTPDPEVAGGIAPGVASRGVANSL